VPVPATAVYRLGQILPGNGPLTIHILSPISTTSLRWHNFSRIGNKPLYEFDDPTYSPVFSVAFSSKGLAAAAGRDPNTIIRSTEFPSTNSATQRLEKHRSEVKTLAFSPNGQMLASASQDGTLNLWDVPTGQFVYSLLVGKARAEKQRPIFGLAFTGDGSRLVSAGSEVLVWDLSLDGWLQRASAIAERNFTPSEWTEFLPDEKYHPTFALGLLMEAHEDALKNDTKAAEAAYRTLTEWVSKGKNADLNYEVGRWGILDGFASAVATACKNAVTMAPAETAWMHFDLRAVELALAGQRADAIHDLENYVQRADGEKMRTRKALLDKLKSGSNLSTADVSETAFASPRLLDSAPSALNPERRSYKCAKLQGICFAISRFLKKDSQTK